MSTNAVKMPNDLDPYWMPFTSNRQFKANPRMFVAAEGMYYTTQDDRKVLDATAGLWCCNAGHRRKRIVEAVQKQVEVLDYAPSFQLGHPLADRAIERCNGSTLYFTHGTDAGKGTRQKRLIRRVNIE